MKCVVAAFMMCQLQDLVSCCKSFLLITVRMVELAQEKFDLERTSVVCVDLQADMWAISNKAYEELRPQQTLVTCLGAALLLQAAYHTPLPSPGGQGGFRAQPLQVHAEFLFSTILGGLEFTSSLFFCSFLTLDLDSKESWDILKFLKLEKRQR